jgi:hypothetical protein
MNLLAGGCSLIYGNEISDATTTYSQLTYPALLAKHLGLSYKCTANPGDGNDSICRKIIEATDQQVKLVVVNWSYHNRFEFHYTEKGWQSLTCTNSLYKNLVSDLSVPFFKELTEIYSWSKYLQDIILLQTFLNSKNIPYIFSSSDNEFFNENNVIKYNLLYQKLYELIDFTRWFYWNDDFGNKIGILKWAKINNYPVGPNHHPLELAHLKTYEIIKNQMEALL